MIINDKEYVTGVFRGMGGNKMVTHLYSGHFHDPGYPMCSRGWQRKFYDENGNLKDWEYSIFRNNISEAGLCKICQRRALEGRKPIEKPFPRKIKYNHRNIK